MEDFGCCDSMKESAREKSSILIIDDFLNNADNALYVAKNSGRNCVKHYDMI